MVASSKAWVYSRSSAETMGSNPSVGMNGWMDVVSVVCCQVEVSATS